MSPKIRSKLYSSYSEKVLKIFIEYLILVSSMSVVVSLDLFSSVMILVISYVLGITYILTHLFYKEKPSFHWIFLLFSVFFITLSLCFWHFVCLILFLSSLIVFSLPLSSLSPPTVKWQLFYRRTGWTACWTCWPPWTGTPASPTFTPPHSAVSRRSWTTR